jgi:hypothetical protein
MPGLECRLAAPAEAAEIAHLRIAMASRRIIKALLLWLVCTAAIALWLAGDFWGKKSVLARRGVATHGVVEKKEPANHVQVRYFYDVEGQRYSGVGQVGLGNPTFEQLSAGDLVLVYYDPQHPYDSCLGVPARLGWSKSKGIIAASAFAAVVAVLSIYAGIDRSRKSAAR